jgi:hypothetical protein
LKTPLSLNGVPCSEASKEVDQQRTYAYQQRVGSLNFAAVLLVDLNHDLVQHQVSHAANSILRQDHIEEGPAPTVGDHWPRRFLNRYPELRKAKQKPLELERKLAHDPVVISNWFERFQQLRDRCSVHDEDIWNSDETGFYVAVRKTQWIVTFSRSKRSYLAADGD